MKSDRVWELSTDQFDIVCDRENVGFSDLINDNPSIEHAVETGNCDVVHLVAEVRSKGGLVLGSARTDAIEHVEHREPFDVFRLDRGFVHDAVMSALAKAIDYLEPADDTTAAKARKLRDELGQVTML